MVDKMPGIEASMLLRAEGQTPPNPTVGGTIVEGALKLGRPSMALISDTELRGMVFSRQKDRSGHDRLYARSAREEWPGNSSSFTPRAAAATSTVSAPN
jgi:hypothetical protein